MILYYKALWAGHLTQVMDIICQEYDRNEKQKSKMGKMFKMFQSLLSQIACMNMNVEPSGFVNDNIVVNVHRD